MLKNLNNFITKILIISFPFLYFIFVYNQFIIQNFLGFTIAFWDFFTTYLSLIIIYSLLLIYFLKKKSLKLKITLR
jgi:hypothetical protein